MLTTRPETLIVTELIAFLSGGRLDLFIILGLMLALVWVVKQWREAEKGRIEDLKTMAVLATEVKNNVATLIELVKADNPRRSR